MFKRNLEKKIVTAIQDTPVVVISGARQTGKTTLCNQLIREKVFSESYITFDTPEILKAAKDDPLGFLRSRERHIVLDEIQKAPELLVCIKQMVDEDRKNRRYILIGSANVMNLPRVSDSLAGRIEIHNLWPLSQAEIRGHEPTFLERLVAKETEFEGHKTSWRELTEMLEAGGYPEVIERKDSDRRDQWFISYINSILLYNGI